MKRIVLIVMGVLCLMDLKSQVVFKSIVSRPLVSVGESFQIQYVLNDIQKDNEFTAPAFKGFRIVSGPHTYKGSSDEKDGLSILKNVVYTLVPVKPGRFIIPGAMARVNGRLIKSDDVIIDVITKREALERSAKKEQKEDPSDYFLRPGEDPYEKMRKNLFMKVLVDRTSSYVGQPVVATFKLYSRLESKSDIVKNPGFYGFSVQDIANLNDNITRAETISGKTFDVHTVRIVQLYPLQEGNFIIDPMEVTTKVEFSKSVVNKRPEQEIIEGVTETDPPTVKPNTVIYENHISSEKITIHVKPYPAAKKPATFNGATGNFTIGASLEKNELAKNEEGALTITIKGKGNFIQLPAPVIQWPKDIEGFEPIIRDSLDKTRIPLNGSRTFRFPFIGSNGGDYSIPAVGFTFFDPDSNTYKTVTSEAVEIRISNNEKKERPKEQRTAAAREKKDHNTIWLYGSIFFVVLLIILVQLKKPKQKETVNEKIVEQNETDISPAELLKPVQFSLVADDGMFYTLLQKSIWDYLGTQLKLSGTKINKVELYKVMAERNMKEQYHVMLDVLEECEAAVFTKAEMMHDKQQLLDKARTILAQIKA